MANKDFINDKYKGAFKWIHLSKPFAFNSMEGKAFQWSQIPLARSILSVGL